MKTITAIILAHYKEREANLKRIVDDLMVGTVVPEKIIIFIDNPLIEFEDDRVTMIKSSTSFLPNIRFAIGLICDTDYCFFIDDDLSVRKKTLENFVDYTDKSQPSILGLEGSILGGTPTPYTNDISVPRGDRPWKVDIIIRTYFLPTEFLLFGFKLRFKYPDLPKTSLDDVFLSLGNKYMNESGGNNLGRNYVIPVDNESDVTELPDGGVGQSFSENHYKNRNIVCKFLMERHNPL